MSRRAGARGLDTFSGPAGWRTVGALKRLSAVRWGVAGRVVWAWVLTIPGAGLVAALTLGVLEAVRWSWSWAYPG